MDQFFAAVEQRDNHELKGKPIAFGHDAERGVVSTASYVTLTIPKLKSKQKLITDASGCIHTQLSINKSRLSL